MHLSTTHTIIVGNMVGKKIILGRALLIKRFDEQKT